MSALRQILRFRQTPSIQPTGVVWDMTEHRGWGDRISWRDYEKRELSGHTTPRVWVGDEIRSPMESGATGRFLVVETEYFRDPLDMWFAVVEDIGYVDEDSPPISRRGVFGNLLLATGRTATGEDTG